MLETHSATRVHPAAAAGMRTSGWMTLGMGLLWRMKKPARSERLVARWEAASPASARRCWSRGFAALRNCASKDRHGSARLLHGFLQPKKARLVRAGPKESWKAGSGIQPPESRTQQWWDASRKLNSPYAVAGRHRRSWSDERVAFELAGACGRTLKKAVFENGGHV